MDYLMDDIREKDRLKTKVDAPAWVDQYLTPMMGYVANVLDVGCGPGSLIAAAAQQHRSAVFSGVDISSDRIDAAVKATSGMSNTAVQIGFAESLPFDSNSFDLVYSRFLLEYLPDKESAIKEMYRVLRPGGRLMIQDLDGQLCWHYPEDESLQARIESVVSALSKTGFDPYVGRKLYHLMRKADFDELTVQAESYHLLVGEATADDYHLWELKLDIAMPAMTAALGSKEAANQLKKDFLAYLKRRDTLSYSIMFTSIGTKTSEQN